MRTPTDLHRFGNAHGPRSPRIQQDLYPYGGGFVGPERPPAPNGLSTFALPANSDLTGHYWRLPADTELPYGLAVLADGEDVGGPRTRGHHTLYPSVRMPAEQFIRLVSELPWEYAGKV